MVGAYYSGTIKEFLENIKNAEQFVENMKKQHSENMKKQHSGENIRQEKAWEESYEHIKKLFELLNQKGYGGIHCFFEYVLPGIGDRIDVILLGKDAKGKRKHSIIVFELKGWKFVQKFADFINAINQLRGYIGKLKYFHSFTKKHECNFTGILWFYKLKIYYDNNDSSLPIEKRESDKEIYIYFGDLYEKLVERIIDSLGNLEEDPKEFLESEYAQSPTFFDLISGEILNMLTCGIPALASIGYSPTKEQMEILEEVMESFEKGEKKCFIIKGGPGSGKTYLAVLIAVEALRRSWKLRSEDENLVAIVYRNNRIVNTYRDIFESFGNLLRTPLLHTFIKYYSTESRYGVLDQPKNSFRLLVCDEAQRINMIDKGKNSIDAIKRAMEISKVCVFFYDEGQILLEEEEGTGRNFIKAAEELRIKYKEFKYKEFELTSVYRILAGKEYYDFVENLLSGRVNEQITGFDNYELYLFDDLKKMIDKLLYKKKKKHKIAIVASFTELERTDTESERTDTQKFARSNLRAGKEEGIDTQKFARSNLRAGKGIPLDVYEKTDIEVYWLIEKEYPKYWIENPEEMILDGKKRASCASVYGCQGFEADYVGVIWGRDMVWDNGWTLGENCTDYLASKGRSLQGLFNLFKLKHDEKAKEKALFLLKNRYRIFLTRGIRGTYIFCEDRKTRDYLSKIIPKFNK
ncbi:MAG: DUF2075 domain-containing protein [Thermodesulfovibrio sp.]|nr:DUF2075 domain-containing protein [Thermodesulfovibrio sp.]